MLKKKYDAHEAEKKWQRYWEKNNIYKFDKDSEKDVYSIDTPPPTLSGKMHMGHAFSYIQADIIARYHRMKGKNVFYPFGTDDNGLPTERLVERLKKVKASKMDRSEFTKLCEQTVDELREDFIQDWKDIGISCDFSLFYSTINDHCRRISQKSFISLYKAGREYRKEAPTIWCPKCETAISQVELEDVEISSTFNNITFKLEDGSDLIIATTRPELLPACVAIFVHPKDKKNKQLIGKKAKVPIFGQEVEVIADSRVDPEKGTGIVMCCTFGDQTDIEWWKTYKLDLKIAISKDGRMTEIAGKYKNLKLKEAREKILKDLESTSLLKEKKPIKHFVNVHERCGTEIEFLVTKQWFIKYLDLKEEFLKFGRELKWYPEHMRNRYDNWVKGLQWDWCISRQRYFGVPFPVWYDKKTGEVVLADESQLPVDPLVDKPKGYRKEVIPEKDVMDTWATSSLTPQIAIELVKGTKSYKKLFPMTLRPQAHDIITFWLFNTVVKSQMHYQKNPWKDCMISGWALDSKGKKMSKSKGNVIEPQEILKKYNADCLRFWAGGSRLGEDVWFSEKDFITGQRLIVKLWNASRFCLSHLKNYEVKEQNPESLEAVDKWMLSKVNKLVKEVTEALEIYDYSKLRNETNNLFWNTFCDYYLEISKDRLYNPDRRGRKASDSAKYTLYVCLNTFLKLFAPILPHVTEEIYQSYFAKQEKVKSIHLSQWPTQKESHEYGDVEKNIDVFVEILSAVRKMKTEKNKPLNAPIKKIIVEGDEKVFDGALEDLKSSTKAGEIEFGKVESGLVIGNFKIGVLF